MFHGKMTTGQEGKDRTEFLIHTVNLPKFSESETLFFSLSILAKVKGGKTIATSYEYLKGVTNTLVCTIANFES